MRGLSFPAAALVLGAATCSSSKALCPGGQASCCHSTDDCDSASVCFPPAGFGCDPAPPLPGTATCLADSDCTGAAEVCLQVACDPTRGKTCVPACTDDASCGEGETCASTGHCVAQACAAGCPPLFVCDAATSVCLREACDRDSDCGGAGVCVDQQCHASLGQCGLID
jgi:hypothetical protein